MANIKIFELEGTLLYLVLPEILLVPEFEAVMNLDKTRGEGTAWKYFKFAYLAYDNRTPYDELTELDRINTSLRDSGLTEEDIKEGVIAVMLTKYKYLMTTGIIRMLNAAKGTVDKITKYLETLDLEVKDTFGKPVHKASDVMRQLKDLADVHEGIMKLEWQVRKEKEASRGIRGDNEPGYNN